jgi:hypothetical protein
VATNQDTDHGLRSLLRLSRETVERVERPIAALIWDLEVGHLRRFSSVKRATSSSIPTHLLSVNRQSGEGILCHGVHFRTHPVACAITLRLMSTYPGGRACLAPLRLIG